MTKQEKLNKYFNQKEKLNLENKKYLRQVNFLTSFFLEEDLDGAGDITTDLFIKENKEVEAIATAKADGILAGLEETEWLTTTYNLQLTTYKKDGDEIKAGDEILKISGSIKDILKLERTTLNLLQRMSGIATQTNKLVKKTNSKVLICPTRKTQWGLLDKKAVTLGGGGTHRLGLYDFVLIKDNHLKITNYQLPITNYFTEIECKTKEQVLSFSNSQPKPDAIMFDNFSPEEIKKLIRKLPKEIIFEASGGITEKNITEYADTGVDVISIGALTHSSKALDISLDII